MEGLQAAIDRACACALSWCRHDFPLRQSTDLAMYKQRLCRCGKSAGAGNITEGGATPLYTRDELAS